MVTTFICYTIRYLLPLSATLYDIYYLYLLHYTIVTTLICYTIRYLLPLSATLYDIYWSLRTYNRDFKSICDAIMTTASPVLYIKVL